MSFDKRFYSSFHWETGKDKNRKHSQKTCQNTVGPNLLGNKKVSHNIFIIKQIRFLGFGLALLLSLSGFAQLQGTDSVLLSPAEVRAQRFEFSASEWIADSNLQLAGLSLPNQLLFDQALPLRMNGVSGLSLPALRGLSGAHTVVIWNGIPLQSSMNGLLDLQLLSLSKAETRLMRGGNSSHYGSGVMTGAIFLDDEGLSMAPLLEVLMRKSAFGNHLGRISFSKKHEHGGSRLHASHMNNRNAFKYINPYLSNMPVERELSHADQNATSLQFQHESLLKKHLHMQLHVWWQKDERLLPANMLESASTAEQHDQNLRTALIFNGTAGKLHWLTRTAFTREQIVFQDLPKGMNDTNIANNCIQRVEGELPMGDQNSMLFVVQHHSAFAEVSGYGGKRNMHQGFFNLSWKHHKDKWDFRLSNQLLYGLNRVELFLPGLDCRRRWRAGKGMHQLHGHINKNYRIPTLNDRFWSPGGNPNLLPEHAWRTEIGYDLEHLNWSLRSRAYAYRVRDMIVWLPSNSGNWWSPVNQGLIYSAGTEQMVSYELLNKPYTQLKWSGSWQFNRSVQSDNEPMTKALIRGKQNIYAPIHLIGTGLEARKNVWLFKYRFNYQSARFVSPSSARQLEAFGLHHMVLMRNAPHWNIGLSCMNIFNRSYEIMAYYPMPGRQISVHTQIQLLNHKHKNQHEKIK